MLAATKTTRDVSELIEAAKKKWDPANLLYGIAMALISSDKLDKSIDISDLDFLETPIVRRTSGCLAIPMVRKNGEPVDIFISVFTLGPVRGMLTAILLCNKVFWTAEVPSRLFEWRNGRHGFIRTLIDKEAAREREITKMKTEFEAAALKEPAEQPATASEPSTQFEDITTEAWAQELAEEIAKEGGYKTKPAAMRVELGLFPDAAIGLVSTDSAFTLAIVVLLDGKISTYEILSADKATEPVAEASTHHQPMVVRCSSGGVIVTLNYRSKHFKDHIHARMTFLKLNKELVDEVDCLNLKTIYQVPATFLGKNALSLVIPEEVDVFYNRLGMLVLTLMRQHRLGRMVVEYVASLDPHTPHHITPKGKMAFSYWLEDTDEKIQLVLESEVKASGDCVILTVTQNGDEYTFMIYAVGCDRAWFVEKFAELQKRCSQQDVMRVRDGKEPKYIHTYRTSYEFQNAIPKDGMYGDFGQPIPIATRWKSKTHRLDTDQTIVEISEAFEKIRLLNDCPPDDFKILTVSDYHDTVKVVLLTPYVRSIYLKKVCPCATKDVYNMVQIVASQLIGEIDEIKESIAAEEADEGGREMEEGRAKTNAVELTRAALSTTDEFYLPFFKAVMQNLANYETLATWGVSPYSIVSVNTSHGKTVSLQGVLSNGQLVKPAIVIEDIQAIWRDCIEVTVSLGPNEEYKAYLRTSRLDGWASETIVKHLSKFHGLPSKKTVQEEELKEPMSLTETLNHIDDSMFLVSFAASVLGFLVKDKGGVEGALPKNMPVINNVVCAYLLPWPGVSFACTGNKLPQTDTAPGVYFIVMRVWQEEAELHIEGHHTAKGLFKAVLGFKDTDQVRDMVARYKTIEAGLKKTPGKEKLYQLNSLPGVPMNGILGFRVDAAAASEPEAASIPPAAVINSAILPREAVYGHCSDKTDAFVFVLMNAIVHSLAAQPTHPESAIFAGFKSFDKVEWRVDKNYDVYVTLISSPVGDKPLTLICLSLGAVEQVTNNLIAENIFGINICLDDKTSLRAYFKSSSGWIAASLSQAIDNISNMVSTEGEHVKVQQNERPPVKAIVFELSRSQAAGIFDKVLEFTPAPEAEAVTAIDAKVEVSSGNSTEGEGNGLSLLWGAVGGSRNSQTDAFVFALAEAIIERVGGIRDREGKYNWVKKGPANTITCRAGGQIHQLIFTGMCADGQTIAFPEFSINTVQENLEQGSISFAVKTYFLGEPTYLSRIEFSDRTSSLILGGAVGYLVKLLTAESKNTPTLNYRPSTVVFERKHANQSGVYEEMYMAIKKTLSPLQLKVLAATESKFAPPVFAARLPFKNFENLSTQQDSVSTEFVFALMSAIKVAMGVEIRFIRDKADQRYNRVLVAVDEARSAIFFHPFVKDQLVANGLMIEIVGVVGKGVGEALLVTNIRGRQVSFKLTADTAWPATDLQGAFNKLITCCLSSTTGIRINERPMKTLVFDIDQVVYRSFPHPDSELKISTDGLSYPIHLKFTDFKNMSTLADTVMYNFVFSFVSAIKAVVSKGTGCYLDDITLIEVFVNKETKELRFQAWSGKEIPVKSVDVKIGIYGCDYEDAVLLDAFVDNQPMTFSFVTRGEWKASDLTLAFDCITSSSLALCSRTDTGFYAKLVFGPDVPRRVTVMVDEASTSDFSKKFLDCSEASGPLMTIKEIPAQMSHVAFIGSSSRAISDGAGFISSFVSSVATALVAEERGNETILQFMQVSHEYLPDSKKLRFGYESLGRPKVQFNVIGTRKDNLDQDVLVMIEMVATGEGKVLRYSPNAAWTETQLFDAFQTVMESCKKKFQLQALGDYMQKQGGGGMDQPGLNRARSLKDVFTESFAAHRPSAAPAPETQVAPVNASSVSFIGWVNPNKEAVVDEMRKTLLKALSKALKKNASNYSVSASGPLMAFRDNSGPESTRDQFAVVLINRKTDTEVWAPLGYTTEGMVVVHPESDAPWFTVGKKLENLLTVYMGSYYITAK